MSLLVGNYDSEYFNKIPEFSTALAIFLSNKSAEAIVHLGKIFVKHNTYKRYGLIMIHRHFPLDEDEILVENINDDKNLSVAMPWKMNGKSGIATPSDIFYWKSFGFEEEQNLSILPHTWAFDDKTPGLLQPFEFFATNEIEDPPPPEFVFDLYEELKKLGLHNIFGLRRVRQNGSAYETTPNGVRANVTKYGEIPLEMNKKDFVQVVFLINQTGQSNFGLWCGNCCNHCNHCTHSNK